MSDQQRATRGTDQRRADARVLNIGRVRAPDEFLELHRLLTVYESDLPEPLRHGSVPEISALMTLYGAPNAAFLARLDDTAIGCVVCKPQDTSTAELARLYVEPHARKSGAGRALVNAVIDFARGAGFERLVLDTHRELLPAACRLYNSLGFAEYQPECGGDDAVCPTFMGLRL
ncbi:MAG: GNAT family N-acetyltransferase [Candidatus Aquilonibacter sp.]